MKAEQNCPHFLLVIFLLLALPARAEEGQDQRPLRMLELDRLFSSTIFHSKSNKVGIMAGRAMWVDELRVDGSRSGEFVTDAIVFWEHEGEAPVPGHRIKFEALPFDEMIRQYIDKSPPPELRHAMERVDLKTGDQVNCLVVLLQRAPEAEWEQITYYVPDPDDGLSQDLERAMQIGRAGPGEEEFEQWKEQINGPFGTRALLDSLRFSASRSQIRSVGPPKFALEVMERQDYRLFPRATNLLSKTKDEVLHSLPQERFSEAFDRAALLIAQDDQIHRRLEQIKALTEIADRLPETRRTELAQMLREHLVVPLDTWFEEDYKQRVARSAALQEEDQKLGIKDPLAEYDGPGQTPEEGRWIELRQRLEAMAR